MPNQLPRKPNRKNIVWSLRESFEDICSDHEVAFSPTKYDLASIKRVLGKGYTQQEVWHIFEWYIKYYDRAWDLGYEIPIALSDVSLKIWEKSERWKL